MIVNKIKPTFKSGRDEKELFKTNNVGLFMSGKKIHVCQSNYFVDSND